MEVTVDLKFEQLRKLIGQLSATQMANLKAELADSFSKKSSKKDIHKFREFLLKGPIMSDEQFEAYQKNKEEFIF